MPIRRSACINVTALAAIACARLASGDSVYAEEAHSVRGAKSVEGDRTFGQDVEFLSRHTETTVLQNESGTALVAVAPAYQARVMTSSATGEGGLSFGWINYDHIGSGEIAQQINVYGGEERFWLGPEGGQFSIFFKPGAKFEFSEWATPA